MLYCKKLDENAKLPTVSHPGEDLGFDIFSIETIRGFNTAKAVAPAAANPNKAVAITAKTPMELLTIGFNLFKPTITSVKQLARVTAAG